MPKLISTLINGSSFGPRREGLFGYLRDNGVVTLALVSGLLFTLGMIPYTIFLSHQTYSCPWWAYKCVVYTHRQATIQGAVTLVYTVGLTCLAYACWALAEISLWPLLCQQPLTLKQIDTYLAVCRGSIPSIPLALVAARRWEAFLILNCAVWVSLTTLSAGPVVGYVFDQRLLPTSYKSKVLVGGGYTIPFTQRNPPVTPLPEAAAFYSDWASGYATNESMPEYREWLIDRQTLADHGNFSTRAVRIQKSVSCTGFNLSQTFIPSLDPKVSLKYLLSFNTSMESVVGEYRHGGSLNSGTVSIYNLETLSVWVDNVTFISANRTSAKVVFAIPDGELEGSYQTPLTGDAAKKHSHISAIACNIDIELIDDILIVGDGGVSNPKSTADLVSLPVISTINELYSYDNASAHPYGTASYTHQELALWFAVAPVTVSTSVGGNQPMFRYTADNNDTDPGNLVSETSTSERKNDPHFRYTQAEIMNLINVSISAMGLGMTLKFRTREVIMDCTVFAQRTDSIRIVLLSVPVLVMFLIWLVLAFWTTKLHQRCHLPIMRMGETVEILQACQAEIRNHPTGINEADWSTFQFIYLREANNEFELRRLNSHNSTTLVRTSSYLTEKDVQPKADENENDKTDCEKSIHIHRQSTL